jgi:RimJ/RimL family protein N-acetyltransferase
MKLNHISFLSEHFLIIPLSENDSSFILELVNTEGWIKFIGNRNINTITDAIAYIQKINSNKNIQYWTVIQKETKSTIGLVTLIQRDYLAHHDIGFAFLPAFHNKGHAYEAAKTVLTSLFNQNLFTDIIAVTLPENSSSIRLLQKLGLKFEREMEMENQRLQVYKASEDEILNRLK